MANANTQLSAMFDELVQQKTFNLDALDAIRALKTKAEALEEDVKRKDGVIKELQAEARAKDERLEHQSKELALISTRETAVAVREAKIHQHELSAAVAAARASAFEQSMKIVFAPNRVRDSVQSWGSVAGHNGMSVPINDSRVISRTEGYAQDGDQDAPGQAGQQPKQTL